MIEEKGRDHENASLSAGAAAESPHAAYVGDGFIRLSLAVDPPKLGGNKLVIIVVCPQSIGCSKQAVRDHIMPAVKLLEHILECREGHRGKVYLRLPRLQEGGHPLGRSEPIFATDSTGDFRHSAQIDESAPFAQVDAYGEPWDVEFEELNFAARDYRRGESGDVLRIEKPSRHDAEYDSAECFKSAEVLFSNEIDRSKGLSEIEDI